MSSSKIQYKTISQKQIKIIIDNNIKVLIFIQQNMLHNPLVSSSWTTATGLRIAECGKKNVIYENMFQCTDRQAVLFTCLYITVFVRRPLNLRIVVSRT